MHRRRVLRIELSFERWMADWALLAFLLVAGPGNLASESLVLSTYYPAPLGVYRQIITTGVGGSAAPTLLARDSVAAFVGIGTTGTINGAKMQLSGAMAFNAMNSGAAATLPAKATMIWMDTEPGGDWLRINQNTDYTTPVGNVASGGTGGVHTPGLFAPGALNVGGVNAWTSPGPGNAAILFNETVGGNLTVGSWIKAGGDITSNQNIHALGYINSVGNMYVGTQNSAPTSPFWANESHIYLGMGNCNPNNVTDVSGNATNICGGGYATWVPGIHQEGNWGMPFTRRLPQGGGNQTPTCFQTDVGCVPFDNLIENGSLQYYCCN
jgi:hypothetical protein